VLYGHVANVLKQEEYRPARLRVSFLGVILDVTVTINTASPIPVNINPLPRDNEGSAVVLKDDRI
jgi:hypothetical protein